MIYSSPGFFTQIRPVSVGDLGMKAKNSKTLWLGEKNVELRRKFFLKPVADSA
jgi:hypothetical protein